jgi:2-polyprenyl-3-methyl-5-hydroxy-6-metoxy-1,4-benzoquinol methylase
MPLFMEDYSPLFSPVRLWMQCDSCGQIYAYNFSKSALKQFEDENAEPRMMMQPKVQILPVYGDIFNNIQFYTKGRKLLEVGAGGGELIAAALEFGYDVTAVEIMKPQAGWLSDLFGIEVIGNDFQKYDFQDKYDVITMGDVIEHVCEPVDAIRKAYDLLNDEGVIWISTPNFKSGFSRVMQFEDPMWNEPWHISYFSRDGLEKILHENGFKVMDYKISKRYNGSMEIIAAKTGGEI